MLCIINVLLFLNLNMRFDQKIVLVINRRTPSKYKKTQCKYIHIDLMQMSCVLFFSASTNKRKQCISSRYEQAPSYAFPVNSGYV